MLGMRTESEEVVIRGGKDQDSSLVDESLGLAAKMKARNSDDVSKGDNAQEVSEHEADHDDEIFARRQANNILGVPPGYVGIAGHTVPFRSVYDDEGNLIGYLPLVGGTSPSSTVDAENGVHVPGSITAFGNTVDGVADVAGNPLSQLEQLADGLPIEGKFGLASQGLAPQPPHVDSGNVTSQLPAGASPQGASVSTPLPKPSGAPNPAPSGLPSPHASPHASESGIPVHPSGPIPPSAPASVTSDAPVHPPLPPQSAEEQNASFSPSSTAATPSSTPQFGQDGNHEENEGGFTTTATPMSTPLMAAFANLPAPPPNAPQPPISLLTDGLSAPVSAPGDAPVPTSPSVHLPVSSAPSPPSSLPVQPPLSGAPSFPVSPLSYLPSPPIHTSVSPPVAPPSALPIHPPVSTLPAGFHSPLASAPKPPVGPADVPVSPPAPVANVTSVAASKPLFMRARRQLRRQGTSDDAYTPVKMKRDAGQSQPTVSSGFSNPTAPISGDTPPLLESTATKTGPSSPTGSIRARAYAYFAPTMSKMSARAAAAQAAAANNHDAPYAASSASATATAEKEQRSGRRRLFRFSRFFSGEGDHDD